MGICVSVTAQYKGRTTARLNSAKEHKGSLEYRHWALSFDETKRTLFFFRLFPACSAWKYDSERVVLTVKHGVILWVSAKGAGEMTFVDCTMNACLVDKIIFCVQKPGRRGTIYHGNNLKYKRVSHNYDMVTYVSWLRSKTLCGILKPKVTTESTVSPEVWRILHVGDDWQAKMTFLTDPS